VALIAALKLFQLGAKVKNASEFIGTHVKAASIWGQSERQQLAAWVQQCCRSEANNAPGYVPIFHASSRQRRLLKIATPMWSAVTSTLKAHILRRKSLQAKSGLLNVPSSTKAASWIKLVSQFLDSCRQPTSTPPKPALCTHANR